MQLYTAMVYQVPSEYHSLMEWRAVLPSTLLDGVQETASSTRRGGTEAWMVEDATGCSLGRGCAPGAFSLWKSGRGSLPWRSSHDQGLDHIVHDLLLQLQNLAWALLNFTFLDLLSRQCHGIGETPSLSIISSFPHCFPS